MSVPRVVLGPTNALGGAAGGGQVVRLRFPGLEGQAFVLAGGRFLELSAHGQPDGFAAWLIGDQLLGDGDVHLATEVDPLFLALPLMDRARRGAHGSAGPSRGGESSGVFCSLEQALCHEEEVYPDALRPAVERGLGAICDIKEVGGDRYYRLNDARVDAWLRLKVAQARRALAKGNPAFSLTDEAAQDLYGAGVVADYLDASWGARLRAMFGVPAAAAAAAAGPGAAADIRPVDHHHLTFADEQQAGFDRRASAADDRAALQHAKAKRDREEKKAAARRKEAKTMHSIASMFARASAKKPKTAS